MGSSFASVKNVTRTNSSSVYFRVLVSLVAVAALACAAWGQVSVPTSRGDNTRSGANTKETVLTPANVNHNNFGHLFSTPIDYMALAQPLYLPNVSIPGQGTRNVVYVVTQNDSAYAMDADNGTQLWHADLTNGGVPASLADGNLPCGMGPGFDREGAVGTPVIDPTSNTMYVVAKTVIKGTVMHFLHALNISTGAEQTSMGSPMLITASSVSKKGHITHFNSLHQKNRPGALLLNGVLYFGFGSNSCNDGNTGWVLAYNPVNLQQVGAFNTSPDSGFASIWQSGNGLAADEAGNMFVSTAESGDYDVASGGQSYSNSILKLTPAPWPAQNEPNQPADFFTPWSVAYLNDNDLDVSSGGPIVLPDQAGQYPHEVIASGKEAIVYVIDRDNVGQFAPGGTDNVIQELQLVAGGQLMSSPAYWNNRVYFLPDAAPLQVLQVSNGLLSPLAQTSQKLEGAHSPSISANGNTNGIVWLLNGNQLQAYDAISLQQLYTSNQVATRDKLPPVAHFATTTVANGKVYVATQGSLEAYGLLHALTPSSGNGQTAPVTSTLPAAIQFVASDPYTGQLQVGITVTFSDGGKGGVFNPASALTNASGVAGTMYTLPKKTGVYTITASAANFGSATATETATPMAAKSLGVASGQNQTGAPGSTLPNPIVARAHDVYGNPVAGVTVNFSATMGASVNPTVAVTDSTGRASTTVRLPATTGTIMVTASSTGLTKAAFKEYSAAQ